VNARTLAWLVAPVLCACGDDAPGNSPFEAGIAFDAGPEGGRVQPVPIVMPSADTGVVRPTDAGPAPGSFVDEDAGRSGCVAGDCAKLADECNVGVCDENTAACVKKPRRDGTSCGSRTNDACTAPDTCRTGVCKANDAPLGAACGDRDVVCHFDDACDGKGHCQDNGFRMVGTACGDSTPSDVECDQADSCDEFGRCSPRHEAVDAPCGDQGRACHNDDGCDGLGHCKDNGFWTAGTCPLGEVGGKCRCGVPGVEPPLGACHLALDVCELGVCTSANAPLNAPCGDQMVPCRQDDRCDGAGHCLDSGAWVPGSCPKGESGGKCLCGRASEPPIDGVCHLQLDLCAGATCILGDAPDGSPCGVVASTECDGSDQCLAGLCDPRLLPDGAPCGDPAVSACDAADSCDGAGACLSRHANSGTPCGAAAECFLVPECDGAGGCLPADPAPIGSTCGSPTDTQCDPKDTCDGMGGCDIQFAPPGAACGDANDTECSDPDTCDGAGACDSHDALLGAPCGDQGQACLFDDECDGAGGCSDNGALAPCLGSLTGVIQGASGPIAGAMVAVLGASPPSMTTTNASGMFSLDVPIDEQSRIHITAGGYWGALVTRTFTAGNLTGFSWTLRSNAAIAAIAASLAPPLVLDPNAAIVHVALGGPSPYGGSGAAQSATSSSPVVPTGPSTYSYAPAQCCGGAGAIIDCAFPDLWFFNTALLDSPTTVSAYGNGLNTCTVTGASAAFPLLAHTLTAVDAICPDPGLGPCP
jgi:hypothetical protein